MGMEVTVKLRCMRWDVRLKVQALINYIVAGSLALPPNINER
jgi:hypothetical protein